MLELVSTKAEEDQSCKWDTVQASGTNGIYRSDPLTSCRPSQWPTTGSSLEKQIHGEL